MSLIAHALLTSPLEPFLTYSLVLHLRKALSREVEPPIELAVKLGFIPKLHELLDFTSESMRLEAIWCLTNIAVTNSEHVNMMRQLGTHTKVVNMIASASEELKEQVRLHINHTE